MQEVRNNFIQVVKTLKEKGHTYKEISANLGLDNSNFSKLLEVEKYPQLSPQVSHLKRLCLTYKVNPNYLLLSKGKMF